jgi:hypothetical protein
MVDRGTVNGSRGQLVEHLPRALAERVCADLAWEVPGVTTRSQRIGKGSPVRVGQRLHRIEIWRTDGDRQLRTGSPTWVCHPAA